MAGFSFYRFKSLNSRLTVMMLIPVSVLLISGGALTFIYTRNLLLDQWNEAAVLKLARAAHSIEMRLTAPMNILNALFGKDAAFNGTGEDVAALLNNLEGILDARFVPDPSRQEGRGGMGMRGQGRRSGRGMGFHRSRISNVSHPVFNSALGGETVIIAIEILDKDQGKMGELEVEMEFDYILGDVANQGWWHSFSASLVTLDGVYLAHANVDVAGRAAMGETGDPFEKKILEKMASAPFGTVASGERPPEMIAGFYTLKSADWVMILFGRGEVVLRPIILFRNFFISGGAAMVILILMLIRGNTRRMVGKIQTLSTRAGKVAEGRYGSALPVTGRDEISRLIASYNTMIDGLKERDFIRNSFGRYVDPEFAKQLMDRPEKHRLGGERRQVVILMSDLRGFTPMSESLPPEIIIEVLNRYFSRMIQIIQSCRGIIVDFFGDAVLVFFDPLDGPVAGAAEKAMTCAAAMQKSMGEVNKDLAARGLPELHMGVGLHAGQVVVGNIGSDARAKYGIVGSAVNITSRIQARAGEGEILASSDLLKFLPEIQVLRSFQAELKGIKEPMALNIVRLPE